MKLATLDLGDTKTTQTLNQQHYTLKLEKWNHVQPPL